MTRDAPLHTVEALEASACPGLFCVQDSAPGELVRALRGAAEAQQIPFWLLRATEVDLTHTRALPEGSLLYTPATSSAALRAVERLWHPQVGTVFRGPLGPLQIVPCQPRAFELGGVPVPRWVPLLDARIASLERAAHVLGGFPLVARHAGGSCGFGIVQIDSLIGLRSWADFVVSRGMYAELVEMVRGTNWRVAVAGGRVVGHCRNLLRERDFRSMSPTDPADYVAPLPEPVAAAALAAVHAIDAHIGGVDVIETDEGRVVVLEANLPFYFCPLQEQGQDIAGAMVDTLRRDATRRLRAFAPSATTPHGSSE